jgi:hypothetical protein
MTFGSEINQRRIHFVRRAPTSSTNILLVLADILWDEPPILAVST